MLCVYFGVYGFSVGWLGWLRWEMFVSASGGLCLLPLFTGVWLVGWALCIYQCVLLLYISVHCRSLGVDVWRWCALVSVGVLVCLVGSRCVPVGYWCALGVLRAWCEIHSLYRWMFLGVVGVAIPGWAWRLQGKCGTSLLLWYLFHFP